MAYDQSESLGEVAVVTPSAPVGLTRAEFDVQIATAHQYPRDTGHAVRTMVALATMDEDAAGDCMYSLPPRGDSKERIEGPSARFAEMLANVWGNCRVSAEAIEINTSEKYVVCRGVFHDLEANSARAATLRTNIRTKRGDLYSADMINNTVNALCSKAARNATVAGIPKVFWSRAYDAARTMIKGAPDELATRRATALQKFEELGVNREQVFDVLGIKSEGDINGDRLVTLRGMFSAIKSGEETVERMFGKPAPSHAIVENPLSSGPTAPATAAPVETDPIAEAAALQDAIDAARAQGMEARAAGRARKAMPPEYRETERTAEADAWRSGWDAGAQEAQ